MICSDVRIPYHKLNKIEAENEKLFEAYKENKITKNKFLDMVIEILASFDKML